MNQMAYVCVGGFGKGCLVMSMMMREYMSRYE